MEESEPNRLRDVEIKRLVRMAEIAFENSIDQKLTLRMRESWHQRYTNTVLALNQLLKDSQYRDYEKRLKVIEESGRVLRRTMLSRPKVRRLEGSTARKGENLQHTQTSHGRRNEYWLDHHSSR